MKIILNIILDYINKSCIIFYEQINEFRNKTIK